MLLRPGHAGVGASVLKFVLAWAALLSCPACAWGQTSTDGAIGGYVVDPGGAALAGATVRVDSSATGLRSAATSGPGGEFLIARLPAGVYDVTVEYPRFERLVLRGVTVELGSVASIAARMKLGSVATSVTVTAGPEASAAAVASTITANEIARLPVKGRRWQTFALLTPTANSDPKRTAF